MNRRLKILFLLGSLGLFLLINYSNCAPVAFNPESAISASSSPQDFSGSVTVGSTGSNPPLDLFFIVDNSASMYENQVRLANSFSSIFQSNSSSLSSFDVNVYLFSTASTVYLSNLSQVPTKSPASVTSVPSYSSLTQLIATPGSIYAYWNSTSGTYGAAPFSEQFNPAGVLALDSANNYNPGLYIAKQGSQTAQQYQAAINSISQDFQNRLAYLNPGNQFQSGSDPVSELTDISSGLCSMARVFKHSSSFIQPGDAAAFIIVSDDNDRLNVRNPNNNQCLDSVIASQELINGSCGHYQANFTYNSSATITYQDSSKFNYAYGTNIAYSYPSTSSCQIQYNTGYAYSYTYTSINTVVTYTKCTESADGFCVNPVPNSTYQLGGNYVSSGSSCVSSVSGLVPSPAPGTSYSCAASNIPNQNGASGIDANSNGSACSSQLLSQLSGQANVSNISCQITSATPSTTTKTISGQALNSCSNYCSSNSTQYPACTLLGSTTSSTSKSMTINGTGLTCSSQCPSGQSAVCGTGTISSYITSEYAGATCGAASNALTSISVMAGTDSTGAALTCSSSLGSLKVENSSGATICAGASTVSSCINSLLAGATCAGAGGHDSTITAPVNVSCTTSCSASGGFCAAPYSTVADFLGQGQGNLCISSSNGGSKSLALTFGPTFAASASCSSLCSQVASGSCDGKGWGATNGATVAQYIQSLGGGTTCTGSNSQVGVGSSIVAQNSNPTASCTDPANPLFISSGSAYPGTATNYTAGDVNHRASDFDSFIVSQSSSIFGANTPVVAVIGHLTTDASLTATDPGTDYFNLAQAMGSNQISSVTASDYSPALSDISGFIVQKSQNSFSLALPSGSKVFSVSVQQPGSQVWEPLDSSVWSWTGQTLSINPSVGLNPGDQIMYQYSD